MDNMVKKRLAVIPARGGSKRIPKKNILSVGGIPMVVYTINAALESDLFYRVLVSTDDEEIAEVAKSFGASVPFMRTSHADDFAPVSDVSVDAVLRLTNEFNEEFDTVVQLMANCPLRNAEDIRKACSYFDNNDHKFQISCFKYGWMNPWWAHELDSDFHPKPIFPDSMRFRRSQDQPDLYCPTGAIWLADRDALIKEKTFYGSDYRFFPVSWINALDIDDYEDLQMLEALMNRPK